MSAPDEPAHTIKAAAVAHGQWLGEKASTQGQPLQVRVPEYIANLSTVPSCYATRPDRDASCAPNIREWGNKEKTAGTTAGNYNPTYYFVTGLPSILTSGQKALYGMRAVSAVWCSVFFALTVAIAHNIWGKRVPVVVALLAVTPMSLFLAGTINPNSVEIAATLCFFVSAYAAFDKALGSSRYIGLAFGASAFVVANLRALSIAWLAIALLAALALRWRRGVVRDGFRALSVGVPLAAVGVVLGLVWFAVANSFESLGGVPVKDTPDQVFLYMMEWTFDFARQYVGVVGWLDTALPTVVFVVWDAAVALVLVGALALWDGRRRIVLLTLMLGIAVGPAILQIPAASQVGYIWQGRYILPLVLVLLVAAGAAFAKVDLRGRAARFVTAFVLFSMATANSYGFLWVMRRYVTGIGPATKWEDLWAIPAWQPPGGWPLLVGMYAAVSLITSMVAFRYLDPNRTEVSTPHESGSVSDGRTGEIAGAGSVK